MHQEVGKEEQSFSSLQTNLPGPAFWDSWSVTSGQRMFMSCGLAKIRLKYTEACHQLGSIYQKRFIGA